MFALGFVAAVVTLLLALDFCGGDDHGAV